MAEYRVKLIMSEEYIINAETKEDAESFLYTLNRSRD